MSNNPIFLITLCLVLLLAVGFYPPSRSYLYPIPGYEALSGTFGELRSNHFHSGMDIKTGGRRGVPLQAIDEGYVYRINVSPYGYGKALYLKHPDGHFSVYAHLSGFSDEIEAHLRQQQRAKEQYVVELYPEAGLLPVGRGELIAYSGNSGSSLGPHLHFELRDSTERILNPLLHYRNIIEDTRPPVVQEIAFEPLGVGARIEGAHDFYSKWVEGSNGTYRLPGIVEVHGPIGLLYRGHDLLNGAGNHCGINTSRLYLDDELIHTFDLQQFAFDETRYINVHLDYARTLRQRRSYQRAFIDPGNAFNANVQAINQGMIHLEDGLHAFRLELEDAHGNLSTVEGQLKAVPQQAVNVPFDYGGPPQLSYDLHRSTLRLYLRNPKKHYEQGLQYENTFGLVQSLVPAYRNGNELVFLLPMEELNLPTRVFDEASGLDVKLPHWEVVRPDQVKVIEEGAMHAFFPHESVYRESFLEVAREPGTDETLSDLYVLGEEEIPVFRRYMMGILPKDPALAKHAVVAYRYDGKWNYMGSQRGEDGRIFASTNDFGTFALMADSLAPELRPLNFGDGQRIPSSQSTLRLYIDDDFSGVDAERFHATLGGEWIGFDYDYKRDVMMHELINRPKSGPHELTLQAWDEAGNKIERSYTLQF